jgi:EPS-associated MarR family transcriptional regulator
MNRRREVAVTLHADSPARPLTSASAIAMSDGNVHYKLMRLLEANPQMSQRDAARELGVSLGKINYCLRALVKKGWVKAASFKNSNNKAAYMYLLTPRGVEEKASLTVQFLQAKMDEYEALRLEIQQMQREADAARGATARRLQKEH